VIYDGPLQINGNRFTQIICKGFYGSVFVILRCFLSQADIKSAQSTATKTMVLTDFILLTDDGMKLHRSTLTYVKILTINTG
jgi:hypothetical protein